MKRLIILLCFVSLFACQDKVICPAFQSTYILDDSTRNAYFSYVWQLDENTRTQYLAQQRSAGNTGEDSVTAVVQQPKTDYYAYAGEKVVPWRIQKRTKFGIIKNVPHPIKKYRLRTAPMENVLAPEPVTNDFVASDFTSPIADSLSIAADSLSSDSLTVEPVVASFEPEEEVKKKGPRYLYGYDPSDNFNVEQQYYNKYFAQRLVDTRPLPEPKPVLADSLTSEVLPDSVQTKKGLKGLFKKKKKREEDTEAADEEGTEPLEEETEEQVPDVNEGGGR